jgi:hypothetical protein
MKADQQHDDATGGGTIPAAWKGPAQLDIAQGNREIAVVNACKRYR